MICIFSHSMRHSFSLLIVSFDTYIFFKKIFIYFLERGIEVEKGRKTLVYERNIDPLVCPTLGTWPATKACALPGNQTSDLLVGRPMLNPLSYTSQGPNINFSR